jgi:CTP synthase
MDSEELENMSAAERDSILKTVDGIVIPGGFGNRGIEGKVAATRWAREHGVPFLGICLGMQVLVIEVARHMCGIADATSLEFDDATEHPVITLIDEQYNVVSKGGTMRLGTYQCVLVDGSKAAAAYESSLIEERHRHRYEFNNNYKQQLNSAGLLFSGICPDNGLAEVAELKEHPFMIGVQFHPEYRATPLQPHPLLSAFMKAIKKG